MLGAGPLAKQNIKDRYYGVNDPVADKMLNRVNAMPKVVPPEDPTITTLYVGGIAPEVQESDLRDYFYPYGEITSIKVVHLHKNTLAATKRRASNFGVAVRTAAACMMHGC